MKRFLEPQFVEGFLIFCVIQPLLVLFSVAVFVCAVIESIWT
jgi:hypothetical protein